MNSERSDEFREQQAKAPQKDAASPNSKPQEVTIVVHGENVGEDVNKDTKTASKDSQPKAKEQSVPKKISAAKVKMQGHLPALEDDADVGVQKHQIVTRDGKPDLAFEGTLLASAAPPSAPQGTWHEYRVYQTSGEKHVFSKVSRSIDAEKQDACEAEVFDPSPSSMPTQLLRSARDLVHSQPLTWKDRDS